MTDTHTAEDQCGRIRDIHDAYLTKGDMAARIAELEREKESQRLAYLQLQLERDALLDRLAEPPDESRWQPIETAPHMRKIIVHYLNKLGKHRAVMACFYEEKSLEMHDDYQDVGTWDEDSGNVFADAGWYEEHDSDNPILPLDGEPTHWMPLPAPPGAAVTKVAPSPSGSREGYYTLSQISYALNRSLSAKTSSGMVDAIVEDLIELLPRVAVTTAAAPPGNSPPWRRAPSFQDALQRKAIDIADEHFGYPARGPAVDGSCMCGYCQYARVRGAMLAAPTKPACRCGHSFAPNHQTPGTECAVEDCPCGSYRPSPETTAPLPVCIYEYEPDDTLYFETGCGKQFVLDAMLELYEFCPYCGKPIEERVSESEPAETNGDRNG